MPHKNYIPDIINTYQVLEYKYELFGVVNDVM